MGRAENGDSMVSEPQQLIPGSQQTAITSEPDTFKRLYGPGRPIPSPPGPMTIYTAPAAVTAVLDSLIATNTDISSPPVEQTLTLSIGVDSESTRLFSSMVIPPGEPFVLPIGVTLEVGEIIQVEITSEVTLTLNGREIPT